MLTIFRCWQYSYNLATENIVVVFFFLLEIMKSIVERFDRVHESIVQWFRLFNRPLNFDGMPVFLFQRTRMLIL